MTEPTKSQKSQVGMLYAQYLLDKLGVVPLNEKKMSLVDYAKKINQLRGDYKIVPSKNASREYLYKLFINSIEIK